MSIQKNCGNPLVTDYKQYFPNQPLAQDLIEFNERCNYWIKNRSRIKDQHVISIPRHYIDYFTKKELDIDNITDFNSYNNSVGAIIPRFWVIGTITRRAVERTWLTSSKAQKDRVGSELRSMVQSPPGFCFVGADVDSEEYWLASIIRIKTSNEFMVASDAGIDRETAKIFNYARLYGASSFFAANLLKATSTSASGFSDSDLVYKAFKMTRSTKGMKNIFGKYTGGTESHFFNAVEENALSPRTSTPFLNSSLNSFASRSRDFSRSNMRSLVNWVVQSSAVDFLHTLLVSIKWLSEYYGLKTMSITLTFHDEVRIMVREEEKAKAILCMQVANLYTRSFFSHKMGMEDLPLSVAFFSSVELDKCIRKDCQDECITPSNPTGLLKEYSIPPGQSHPPESLNCY
ncbi:MAG: hypothetical protein MHPSP_000267 [Paramarteilia canceri]